MWAFGTAGSPCSVPKLPTVVVVQVVKSGPTHFSPQLSACRYISRSSKSTLWVEWSTTSEKPSASSTCARTSYVVWGERSPITTEASLMPETEKECLLPHETLPEARSCTWSIEAAGSRARTVMLPRSFF